MLYGNYSLAVDGTPLTRDLTGIGRFLYYFIDSLASSGVCVTIYSPAPLVVQFQDNNNIKINSHNFKRKASKLFWWLILLPILLNFSKYDYFLAPAHKIPFFLRKRITKILFIHDVVYKKFPKTMRYSTFLADYFLMPNAIKRADRIVAVSESTKKDLNTYFCKKIRNKVQVLHLAPTNHTVLNSKKNAQHEYILNEIFAKKQKFILFVGTIEPRKNILRILKAYNSLDSELRSNYKLLLAGSYGWGGYEFFRGINELKLSSDIQFLGRVDDNFLQKLYANAHLVLYPSLYEGFGLPIIEAHAHGVPVVTSNNSSMKEIFGGGGLLVSPESTKDIAYKMTLLLTDSQLWKQLSARAYANASQYTWMKTVNLFKSKVLTAEQDTFESR